MIGAKKHHGGTKTSQGADFFFALRAVILPPSPKSCARAFKYPKNLVRSMPRRLEKVSQMNGGMKKYLINICCLSKCMLKTVNFVI